MAGRNYSLLKYALNYGYEIFCTYYLYSHIMVQFYLYLSFRTYHKDSYITQRRGECLGQEGRYRRTSSPSTSGPSFPKPFSSHVPQTNTRNRSVSTGITPKEDFHRSLIHDEKEKHIDAALEDVTYLHANQRVGLPSSHQDASSITSGK